MPQSSASALMASNPTSLTCDCLAHRFGNAGNHPYRRPRYPSDMSDAEWAAVLLGLRLGPRSPERTPSCRAAAAPTAACRSPAAAPLPAPITGRIDGRPWRESPITAGELPALCGCWPPRCSRWCATSAACAPARSSTCAGCRATDPDTGELLLGRRGKAPGLWTSCRAAGTQPGLGQPVRCGDRLSLPDGRRQFAR